MDDSDCDDTEASINEGAIEIAGDGVDQNCDGMETCFEEADGDGYPSAVEIESSNIDCSGTGESLASTAGEDCNDQDPGQYPGAPEYCNLEDDDCNGHSAVAGRRRAVS